MTTRCFDAALAMLVLGVATTPLAAQQDSAKTRANVATDTSQSQQSTLEIRLGLFTMPSKRTVATSAVAYSDAAPSMTGAEFVVRSTDGQGLRFRYSTASTTGVGRADGALTYLDGRFEIGTREFNVEAGYLLRSETISGTKTQLSFWRAGFRSDIRLGASGVTAGFAASYMRQPAPETDGSQGWGLDGETSVLYASAKVPLYAQLGFRRETLHFTLKVPPDRPEEMSTVFVGVGYHIGLLR